MNEDLFVYFSKLSEEFDMISSRVDSQSPSTQFKNSFGSENSNLYLDFYKQINQRQKNILPTIVSEKELFNSNLEDSEFHNVYENLERMYKPKMIQMDIEENGNLNEGLEALLEGFSGFLRQIRNTFSTDSHELIKKSFDSRMEAYESKWKEIIHQMILGNVKLESKKSQIGGDIFFQNKVISLSM
jgi:hypothetical protein